MKHNCHKAKFIFIPFAVAAFLFILSGIVMLLWNNILPEVTGAGHITYWQAMGLFVLAKILFGFGKRGPEGGPGFWWRKKLARKMKQMTPEEREKFREEMFRRVNCPDFRYSPFYRGGKETRDPDVPETEKNV